MPFPSTGQVAELLRPAGIHGPLTLALLKRGNDVYRVDGPDGVVFVKLHTKDWYADDPSDGAGCVQHEASAYSCLHAHKLPAPNVVLALASKDNPVGRPCLVTRQLPGKSLTVLLSRADADASARLLEAAGDYLRRMHAITFAYPGYIIEESGPTAPPDPESWQHPCWTADRARRDALRLLEPDRQQLAPDVVARLETLFQGMAEALAPDHDPPHFVHGDCHAHQLSLAGPVGAPRVTGVVDLEVASAGDTGHDLVKFALEKAALYPGARRWWEPFFAGYGGPPDFELFRLRLLATGDESFRCFGPDRWSGSRTDSVRRLLDATDWSTLFSL